MAPMSARSMFISAAAAVALVAGGTATAGAGTGPGQLPLSLRAVPTPGLGSELKSVFCVSASDCWAVGNFHSSGIFNGHAGVLNQALHWDGSTWSQVTTPDPGGTANGDFNDLFGVSCGSATDCWAVGAAEAAGGPVLNQALHWDGGTWSQAATPEPGGTVSGDESALHGVRCRPSGSCLAVGDYVKGRGAPFLNQALRWNGRRWSALPVPDPAGRGAGALNFLTGLSCTSATDCWAVGLSERGSAATVNQALHWNGTKWSTVSTPDPGGRAAGHFSELRGDYCISARNCWAAGTIGSTAAQNSLNQVLHWNGRRWAVVSVPDPAGAGNGVTNALDSVTCATAALCWAVGSYGHAGRVNQVLRWNGHAWRLAASPDPGGTANGDFNDLSGVRCASAALCFAVGEAQPSGQHLPTNEALLWNGRRWIAD